MGSHTMPDDTCLKCFHPVKESAQFCENCGARMTSRAPSEIGQSGATRVRVVPGGESIPMTLVSAALFLYVGFGYGLVGVSDSALYNASVTAFTWGARAVGIGLLLVAALTAMRLSFVFAIDLVVSFTAAAGCLIVGVIWILHSDMSGVLLLLFGAFNSTSARNSWVRFRQSQAASGHV